MRYSIYIALISFTIFSCSGDNESDTTEEINQEEDVTSMDIPPEAIDEEIEVNEENDPDLEEDFNPDGDAEPFPIDKFPSDWIMLTDKNGDGEEMFIYNYCEAERPSFQIIPEKGENWTLFCAFGQDGDMFELQNFKAYQSERELFQVVEGSFDLIPVYGDKERHVMFWWNRDMAFGHFEGMSFGSNWFVPEEDIDNYEQVDEDCEGLWD